MKFEYTALQLQEILYIHNAGKVPLWLRINFNNFETILLKFSNVNYKSCVYDNLRDAVERGALIVLLQYFKFLYCLSNFIMYTINLSNICKCFTIR